MSFKNQRIIGSFKYMICINLFHACNRTLDNSNGSPTLPTLKRVIESFSLWYELFVIAIFLNNKIQRLETCTITLLLGISYLFIPKESDVSFKKLLPLKIFLKPYNVVILDHLTLKSYLVQSKQLNCQRSMSNYFFFIKCC